MVRGARAWMAGASPAMTEQELYLNDLRNHLLGQHVAPCPRIAQLCGAIPGIDIGRAARFMLRRYGEAVLDEGSARVKEIVRAGEDSGGAVWRQTMAASTHPANTLPA